MIRALVVDDEPLVRERLRTLLGTHSDVLVVGERGDGPSALEAFRELSPQVVFLDIQLPGLTGLEVAEVWRQDGPLPVIVFVTAFDQFALDAFRLNALDYLTKPIDSERFSDALDRVREFLKSQDRGEFDRRIQAMLDMYERRQAVHPNIVVREHGHYLLVPTAGIHALEATGNYVNIYCDPASHILRGTLSSLEAKMDPRRFLRTHRSWIVNLDHVREVQPSANGNWIVLTRAGLKIPVAQQYRDSLLNTLK